LDKSNYDNFHGGGGGGGGGGGFPHVYAIMH
jgi:hypothetical protein